MEFKIWAWMFFLSTRPSYTHSYLSGIQNEVSIASLSLLGCAVCHETMAISGITSAQIGSCTGPHIFVGAGSLDSPTILIGAFVSVAEIMKQRTPHLSNGVYWYYREGHFFGFSDTPDVLLKSFPGGTNYYGDYEMHDVQHGLLWDIDGFKLQSRSSVLGSNSRSNSMEHSHSSDLQKWIYNCPG